MAQDTPLTTTFVVGLEARSDFVDRVDVRDMRGPPEAQKRPQEEGACHRCNAHELDESQQRIRVGQSGDDRQRKSKKQADETSRLHAGDQTDPRAVNLGHVDG